MKKVLLTCTVIASIMASCTSNNADKKTNDSAEKMIAVDTTFKATNPKPVNATNCYTYTKNKDTASFKLVIQGEELTGDLSYNWFEKDKNKGTIAGELKGDTVIAEYTFDSEGMRSVREVVFLNKDGKFYEGVGDVEEKSGKTIFKNRAALKFTGPVIFSAVDCK